MGLEYTKYIIDVEDTVRTTLDGKEYHLTSEAERFIILDSILKRLTPYDENDAYQRGLNDAWEAVSLFAKGNRYSNKKMFGCYTYSEFFKMSAYEAIAKLKEYEQKKADDKPFNRIKAQIESMMHVQGINIADICMAVEELREEAEC